MKQRKNVSLNLKQKPNCSNIATEPPALVQTLPTTTRRQALQQQRQQQKKKEN